MGGLDTDCMAKVQQLCVCGCVCEEGVGGLDTYCMAKVHQLLVCAGGRWGAKCEVGSWSMEIILVTSLGTNLCRSQVVKVLALNELLYINSRTWGIISPLCDHLTIYILSIVFLS